MRRGIRPILPLALLWLLAACAPPGLGADPDEPSRATTPATAIALSVSADAVYLVDPEDGVRRTVVQDLRDFQAGYATWAPDHRRLAFGNNGIFILDAMTAGRTALVEGSALTMPAWSRDGKRIAYGDGLGLLTTPVVGLDPTGFSVPETLAPLGMAWRPGSQIAFQGLELDCSTPVGCASTELSEVWTIAPDGSGLTQVTEVGHAESPKWSPDGSKLLFVRGFGGPSQPTGPEPGRSTELWEVNADGTGARQMLPLFDVIAADWSPDGAALAIVRPGERPRTLQVWLAGADGLNLRPVGNPVPGTHATIDW
jgi:hypothetical protein